MGCGSCTTFTSAQRKLRASAGHIAIIKTSRSKPRGPGQVIRCTPEGAHLPGRPDIHHTLNTTSTNTCEKWTIFTHRGCFEQRGHWAPPLVPWCGCSRLARNMILPSSAAAPEVTSEPSRPHSWVSRCGTKIVERSGLIPSTCANIRAHVLCTFLISFI